MKTLNIILIISLLVYSCSTNESELKELKDRITGDSLLLLKVNSTIETINGALDSISSLHNELSNSESINKDEAISKINLITQILKQKDTEISDLENEIEKLESSLPKGFVTENKTKIKLQLQYYDELKVELENIKKENVNLNEIIIEKNKELASKDNIIIQLEKERTLQKIKLENLNTEIIIAENEFNNAKLNTAKTYYELSNDLKNLADKTSGILAKKKEKNLINIAYDYYKKSYELGFNKAKMKIEQMETNKKYYKYIDK